MIAVCAALVMAASVPLATASGGAGEAGLRDRLEAAFRRAEPVWAAASIPYLGPFEDTPDQHWKRRASASQPADLRWVRSCAVDSTGAWDAGAWEAGGEAEQCSTHVYTRFAVDGDTLATTFGRVPEDCNEIPRLQWRDRAGRAHREPLAPVIDYNVSALWVTPSWLVFGLTALYEGGGTATRLAAWNLASGDFRQSPQTIWLDGDHTSDPEPHPFELLGGMSDVEVAEGAGALYLRRGAGTLVLWPHERAWSHTGPERRPRSHDSPRGE